MLLPGRIFRRYFARVVLPVQVAPLGKEVVDICVLGDCGECAPYANDDYPVLDHRSAQILSEGVGIESVGKSRRTLIGKSSESAGLVFVRNHHTATTSTSKQASSPQRLS